MFELKAIARESIPRALEKAERYRLLNEPFFAESICLDVLALEPAHQKALVLYVLALSDQLRTGAESVLGRAREAIAKLTSEYERHYYTGILYERRGVAFLDSHAMGSHESAWQNITDAMRCFEDAMKVRPAGDDDAILRMNTCVRLMQAHRLVEPQRMNSDFPLE
jgi:hypothetical protein